MTTMLEKIAKALCKTDSRLHDWKSERAWIAQRSRYFDLARAALQAIREPNREILIASGMLDEEGMSLARSIWSGMVGEILEETPG